jgi:hypothetical protein
MRSNQAIKTSQYVGCGCQVPSHVRTSVVATNAGKRVEDRDGLAGKNILASPSTCMQFFTQAGSLAE